MPDKPPLSVICAANEGYAAPMTVMLTSLVCNLKTDRDVDVYIIESRFPDALREKVEASVLTNKKDFHRLTFHWLKFDPTQTQDLPVGGHLAHITAEAYARLLAPGLLPVSCSRAVYLDCDLVVLADIADLQDAIDDEHVLGAVSEVFFSYVSTPKNERDSVVFDYAERGIPATNRYFGSGVLALNLDLWRKENVTARVLDYIRTNKDRIYYHDQGGLNAVLHDRWLRLDQRWNQTTDILYPERWRAPAYSRQDYLHARNQPYIVHYTGSGKPWEPGQKIPRTSFFNRYLKRTLFKDELTIHHVEDPIGFRAYLALWRLRRKLGSMLHEMRSR